MNVFNSLAPVFCIVLLGAALRACGFLNQAGIAPVNRLVYWVGMPCLLFGEVARSDMAFAGRWDAIGAVLAATIACLALAWSIGRALGLRGPALASMAHAAFRGNLAFVGLAVLHYSAPADGPDPMPLAVIVLTIMVAFYNAAGVTVLLLGRHRLSFSALGRIAGSVASNPLLLSSLGGLAYRWLVPTLPIAADRTLEALGQISLPLALLAIGVQLDLGRMRGGWGAVLVASSIKVIVGPACVWLLARWIGLDALEQRVAVIFMACPTAAASYVLADQLHGDREVTAGIVALSTLLSIGSLSIAVVMG
jgi:predicted permease